MHEPAKASVRSGRLTCSRKQLVEDLQRHLAVRGWQIDDSRVDQLEVRFRASKGERQLAAVLDFPGELTSVRMSGDQEGRRIIGQTLEDRGVVRTDWRASRGLGLGQIIGVLIGLVLIAAGIYAAIDSGGHIIWYGAIIAGVASLARSLAR